MLRGTKGEHSGRIGQEVATIVSVVQMWFRYNQEQKKDRPAGTGTMTGPIVRL